MKKAAFATFAIIALSVSSGSAQCPMCKTALKSNQEGGKSTVGNGINQGILFLMAMPYVLVGAAGFAWYKNRQKKNA